ncbi:hypothetical protein U1Q18_002183 [Sarracenia purpurea var. burkii]
MASPPVDLPEESSSPDAPISPDTTTSPLLESVSPQPNLLESSSPDASISPDTTTSPLHLIREDHPSRPLGPKARLSFVTISSTLRDWLRGRIVKVAMRSFVIDLVCFLIAFGS